MTEIKKFKIQKKGRKYFECLLSEKYKCKLEITEEVKDLKDNEVIELEVEDISIRSKYGTELKFRPISKLENENIEDKYIIFKADYDEDLLTELRKLGGYFDTTEKVWLISKEFKERVEELDFIYNSPVKKYLISFENFTELRKDIFNIVYEFFKRGRMKKGFEALEGEVYMGGSHKYPCLTFTTGAKFVVNFKEEKIKILSKKYNFEFKEI